MAVANGGRRSWRQQLHAHLLTSGAIHRHLPPLPSSTSATSLCNAALRSHPLPFLLLRHMRRNAAHAPPDAITYSLLLRAPSTTLAHVHALHANLLRSSVTRHSLAASALLRAYSLHGLLDPARQVFDEAPLKDNSLWATMVNAYARARRMLDARHLFDQMPLRDVVAWTTLVAGYAHAGLVREATKCFTEMVSHGVAPDSVAVISVLPACGRMGNSELGKWIHWFIVREGIEMTDNLVAALVDMYAKCGDMGSARRVFDSVGWTVLPAWSSIIDGYCKFGDMEAARVLFEAMTDRTRTAYNTMILGYVRSSLPVEALQLFNALRRSGLDVDGYTMVGVLTACSNLGELGHGKALHALVIGSTTVDFDVYVGTALLDMYAKCGRINEAMIVFERMAGKDVLTWTAMISGLAVHGKGRLALEYFESMQAQGIWPNKVAYVGVLNACSHSGLLDEGRMHFREMQSRYGIEPEIEHYGCMVDLLGRCGHLGEAEELIRNMGIEPNDVIWNSLLRACKIHKDVDMSEKVAGVMMGLDSCEDGAFVQLHNIYVSSGRWKNASEIRQRMEKRGIRKIAGYSSITVRGWVHKFSAGDRSHPEILEIEEMLQEMTERSSIAGYTPVASEITEYMDEEEKERYSFGHSEMLAVAYGILRLGGNLPIQILKNLRICENCHAALKLIAKIWNREIVVRDRSRFHHFGQGHCSCGDFW